MRNVLAVLIATGGEFGKSEAEVLSAGARLAADLSGPLTAATVGGGDGWSGACFAQGASKVYVAESAALASYQPQAFAEAIAEVAKSAGADVLLFPSTTAGLELAPQVGYRLGASVVMDIVGVDGKVEGGGVRIQKPVFGGKAQSSLIARNGPLVLGLRMRSFEVEAAQAGAQGEVVMVPVAIDTAPAWKIVERNVEKSGGLRLEDARIIVSGGRGLGEKENFVVLEELGKVLGAALGASRAAVDLGWVPSTWQIGQTGKKVAPELYLAVGISGASQHMVGIAGAKHIVAVNKDEKAPIFQMAEYGVVEDYKPFIPKLVEAVMRRKEQA